MFGLYWDILLDWKCCLSIHPSPCTNYFWTCRSVPMKAYSSLSVFNILFWKVEHRGSCWKKQCGVLSHTGGVSMELRDQKKRYQCDCKWWTCGLDVTSPYLRWGMAVCTLSLPGSTQGNASSFTLPKKLIVKSQSSIVQHTLLQECSWEFLTSRP